MRRNILNTTIFKEFDSVKQKELFYTKNHGILENVDTLYYNVFLSSDTNDNNTLKDLFSELDIIKECIKETREVVEYKGLEVKLGSYSIYNYRLSMPDLFDIFISDYLPNSKTARIVIQLRSYGLWVHGVKQLLNLSYDCLTSLLIDFDVSILRTLENRFDYAYHTNMIQDAINFFSDEKIINHCETTMNTYSKVGELNTNDGILSIDYFSLGHRRSNNLFIRIYNKTREVIENGYKAFFFQLWYEENLISFYDKYCLEFAYIKKSYESLHLARLNFYLEYGLDFDNKQLINDVINNTNSRYKDFKELADKLLPKVTIINNIEFETKRSFYRFSDKQIDYLRTDCCTPLSRIYKIYENRNIFLEYLTSKTLRFVKLRGSKDNMSWWDRIHKKKLSNINKDNRKLIREYSTKIDLESAMNRTINSLATTSLYKSNIDTSMTQDFSIILGLINDNNLNNLDTSIALVDNRTGEVIDSLNDQTSYKYSKYKEKKYSQIKNRISTDCLDRQITSKINDYI